MAEDIQKNKDEENSCVLMLSEKCICQKIADYEWMDVFTKTCPMLSLCSN